MNYFTNFFLKRDDCMKKVVLEGGFISQYRPVGYWKSVLFGSGRKLNWFYKADGSFLNGYKRKAFVFNMNTLRKLCKTVKNYKRNISSPSRIYFSYVTIFSPIAAPKTIMIKTILFQSFDSPYKSIPSIAAPEAPIPVQIA